MLPYRIFVLLGRKQLPKAATELKTCTVKRPVNVDVFLGFVCQASSPLVVPPGVSLFLCAFSNRI